MKCKALFIMLMLASMGTVEEPVRADELVVAVASNFSRTLEQVAQRFEVQSGHSITLVTGATGRHFAQIVNGAPYDLFFSADGSAPALLEEQGKAVAGTRVVYASGRLALWSRQAGLVDGSDRILREGLFRRIALANPRVAPYGEAAMDVINALGLSSAVEKKLVRGENIAQTYQFADSGNAELAFVAYSQVLESGLSGSYWLIPSELHRPMLQEAILLKDTAAGRGFLTFVMQLEAQTLIANNGYVSVITANPSH